MDDKLCDSPRQTYARKYSIMPMPVTRMSTGIREVVYLVSGFYC